jgi:hypothetical protein
MKLTPEAGTIKTGKPRSVPLHSHIVEQGFVEFVKANGSGPLFYNVAKDTGYAAGQGDATRHQPARSACRRSARSGSRHRHLPYSSVPNARARNILG